MFNGALMVLPEKGEEALLAWHIQADVEGSIAVWDLATASAVPDAWKKLCLTRVIRRVQGDPDPLEVFLCAIGDELAVRRDVHGLARVLAQLRDHTWGAKLFLVASSRLEVTRELVRGRATLESWLAETVAGRAVDLLQFDYDPADPSTIDPIRLREAVAETSKRRQLLSDLYPPIRPWRCILPPDPNPMERLLGELALSSGPPHPATDLMIVLNEEEADLQLYSVQKSLGRYRHRRFVVATLKTRPSPRLVAWCRRQGLAVPVRFHGELELWYALLRLNRAHPGLAPHGLDVRPARRRKEGPIFVAADGLPVLLLTSAFEPGSADYCLDAARDVGALLHGAPLEVPYRVESAFDRDRLVEVLDQPPRPNVWIHSGHGAQGQGLWQAGLHPSPALLKWLECFRGRDLRLDLAIFLTCYSAEVARLFAEAGTGVAVGFEGEVNSTTARELAVGILQAVLPGGLERTRILEGFRAGAGRFLGVTPRSPGTPCRPRAFYSSRR